jgi:hypothetical protein
VLTWGVLGFEEAPAVAPTAGEARELALPLDVPAATVVTPPADTILYKKVGPRRRVQ